MRRELNFRLRRMQQMVRIDAVNDIDLMPGVAQRVAEAIEIHCVAAEAVRRIECGQV
jgi:hypothetical protein